MVITVKKAGWYIAKIKCKIKRSEKPMLDFYRRMGMKLGKDCLICSYVLTKEPFLIDIGDNTCVSTGVEFVTHDYSSHLIIENSSNLFGRISIGSNCFIGANSIIMYGVTLANNIVVAAGSVVTKSFDEETIIIGGNPARKIGTWDAYREKYKDKAAPRIKDMPYEELYKSLKECDRYIVKK